MSKANMLKLIDNWFAPVTSAQDYQRSDYVVLWLILAIGVILRFWGLDNVGLHGDEETMALPAMALLETGKPLLPSGMYYPRALINIYLMSGSVLVFGESEWAFRLPSAIVGSLTGLAAFFMGRRFLSPQLNLAFVATITFLPSMIEVSQTARMYVFFVTCMIWFAACVFRWERDQRFSSLLLTLFVWLLCLHFHTLAILAAPLFLYPGLSLQSWRQLMQGAVAFIVGYVLFRIYDRWIGSKYPGEFERPPIPEDPVPDIPFDVFLSANDWLTLASVTVILVLAAILVVRVSRSGDWTRVVPVFLVASGLLAMAVLQYHVGGILILFGTVFWLRAPELSRGWLLALLLAAAALTVAHLGILHSTGLYPGRKLIGALVGTPSIWPVLRFFEYSPLAALIFGVAFLVGLTQFIRHRPLPIHFLYFVMAVWAPLLILGFFAWYIPSRYAQGQIGYFLLCAFAGLSYLAYQFKAFSKGRKTTVPSLLLLVLVSVAFINPVALGRAVNPSYDRYPDHKGAAEFIKSLDLDDDAVLIAEDVLQQAYYLKDIDYYLRQIDDAVHFAFVRDGGVFDQYTGVPVIGTGKELEALLEDIEGRNVYIIGSGENFVGQQRMYRERGISDVLESDRLDVVYDGRDGKTKVWRAR